MNIVSDKIRESFTNMPEAIPNSYEGKTSGRMFNYKVTTPVDPTTAAIYYSILAAANERCKVMGVDKAFEVFTRKVKRLHHTKLIDLMFGSGERYLEGWLARFGTQAIKGEMPKESGWTRGNFEFEDVCKWFPIPYASRYETVINKNVFSSNWGACVFPVPYDIFHMEVYHWIRDELEHTYNNNFYRAQSIELEALSDDVLKEENRKLYEFVKRKVFDYFRVIDPNVGKYILHKKELAALMFYLAHCDSLVETFHPKVKGRFIKTTQTWTAKFEGTVSLLRDQYGLYAPQVELKLDSEPVTKKEVFDAESYDTCLCENTPSQEEVYSSKEASLPIYLSWGAFSNVLKKIKYNQINPYNQGGFVMIDYNGNASSDPSFSRGGTVDADICPVDVVDGVVVTTYYRDATAPVAAIDGEDVRHNSTLTATAVISRSYTTMVMDDIDDKVYDDCFKSVFDRYEGVVKDIDYISVAGKMVVDKITPQFTKPSENEAYQSWGQSWYISTDRWPQLTSEYETRVLSSKAELSKNDFIAAVTNDFRVLVDQAVELWRGISSYGLPGGEDPISLSDYKGFLQRYAQKVGSVTPRMSPYFSALGGGATSSSGVRSRPYIRFVLVNVNGNIGQYNLYAADDLRREERFLGSVKVNIEDYSVVSVPDINIQVGTLMFKLDSPIMPDDEKNHKGRYFVESPGYSIRLPYTMFGRFNLRFNNLRNEPQEDKEE